MSNNINEVSWRMEELWQGCILASIAHAIMVAHYPELSNEHSWDGINYNIQDVFMFLDNSSKIDIKKVADSNLDSQGTKKLGEILIEKNLDRKSVV